LRRPGQFPSSNTAFAGGSAAPASGAWLAAGALVAGVVLSVGVYFAPGFDVAYHSVSLTVGYEVFTAVAALAAAYVLLGRTRDPQLCDYLTAAAFVVIVIGNLFFLAVPVAHLYGHISRFSVWSSSIARMLEGLLFVAAAFAGARRLPFDRRTAVIGTLGATGVACLAIAVPTAVFARRLPLAIDYALSPVGHGVHLPAGSRAVALTMVVSAVLLGVAGARFAARAGTNDPFYLWLAAGLVASSLACLNFALFPSVYSSWVYVGDILQFAFALAVLLGVAGEVRLYWRQIVGAAVLEERRRIARELHDGLAQELAFIASRSNLLGSGPLAREIASAAERALDESRRAIDVLTRPLQEPLEDSVRRAAEEVAARYGTPLTLHLEPGIAATAARRDVLRRITREATINAAQHGHARHVAVTLASSERGVRLVVEDDGSGFDATAPTSGFGLISMRERVESLAGQFVLRSQPGVGTVVDVALP
jgi:signal transduction histidine kinase